MHHASKINTVIRHPATTGSMLCLFAALVVLQRQHNRERFLRSPDSMIDSQADLNAKTMVVYSPAEKKVRKLVDSSGDPAQDTAQLLPTLAADEALGCVPAWLVVGVPTTHDGFQFLAFIGGKEPMVEYVLNHWKPEFSLADACISSTSSHLAFAQSLTSAIVTKIDGALVDRGHHNLTDPIAFAEGQTILNEVQDKLAHELQFHDLRFSLMPEDD